MGVCVGVVDGVDDAGCVADDVGVDDVVEPPQPASIIISVSATAVVPRR